MAVVIGARFLKGKHMRLKILPLKLIENFQGLPVNKSFSRYHQHQLKRKHYLNKKRSNEQVEEPYKFMRNVRESINCKDEFTVYGETLASRMRVAGRIYRAVLISRNHIDNIIFNLEMGLYNERFTSPSSSYHGASQS
uniref:(California timema) hypothetical protein n=1 Tax=Timema californicum TaxID=61474 RepID=A0A7R9JIK3_TIMCA|nr:unnamed protein product [Timema californicum]